MPCAHENDFAMTVTQYLYQNSPHGSEKQKNCTDTCLLLKYIMNYLKKGLRICVLEEK